MAKGWCVCGGGEVAVDFSHLRGRGAGGEGLAEVTEQWISAWGGLVGAGRSGGTEPAQGRRSV